MFWSPIICFVIVLLSVIKTFDNCVILRQIYGLLISKCLFGVFNFLKKTNKNKSAWGFIVVKENLCVHFLEETALWKICFDFVSPLGAYCPNIYSALLTLKLTVKKGFNGLPSTFDWSFATFKRFQHIGLFLDSFKANKYLFPFKLDLNCT